MERINPELKGLKIDRMGERLEKLEPVDMSIMLKRLDKAGYEVIYTGTDFNGMPHFKVSER